MQDQTAELDWQDGVTPVARRFGDPYFSLSDGLAETRHVFLSGNGLPARARPGFAIAELGFGTGLNLLATCAALAETQGAIHYTSFERYPMAAPDMARALAAFPELDAAPLVQVWAAGARSFALGQVQVQVIIGDVGTTLPDWPGRADAWFLDGFAPARNPDMWSPAIMAEVARHTAPGGTFATYTAAGAVRRALAEAGFTVTRLPGHGRKRHMSVGHLP